MARKFPLEPRRAFTLIELLVVTGIISLLIGLTLPAVQASREAARRARCRANLSQLAQATHAFEATFGGFPPSQSYIHGLVAGHDSTNGAFALHCQLLPFLDQSALFQSINFEVYSHDFGWLSINNSTQAETLVETFLCPSEPSPRYGRFAATSYRGNHGICEITPRKDGRADTIGFHQIVKVGAFTPNGGLGLRWRATPLAEFRDGLSNTLTFSEKPVGSGPGAAYHPFRDWFEDKTILAPHQTADDWISACAKGRSAKDNADHTDSGGSWFLFWPPYTLFFASAPPNFVTPDCGLSSAGLFGLYTARSYHPGGVNAAMCDGSVRWFTSGTSTPLWRALGTRDGGEQIPK